MSNPRRANGHRRNQVRRRVLAEESECWLCGGHVDKTLGMIAGQHGKRCVNPDCPGCVPHPMSATVDEVVPVAMGGDPLARANCRLAHRACNIKRGDGTRTVIHVKPFETSRRW